MGSIYQKMSSFFNDDGWPVFVLGDAQALQINFQGTNGSWTCYAQARDETSQMVFYSVCPVTAPEAKRAQVAEYITRANYGLVVGNFEMDYDDGEVRYKTSIDVEGTELTTELIRPLVYANVWTMDRYLPGIMAVAFGGAAAGAALKMIEGNDD